MFKFVALVSVGRSLAYNPMKDLYSETSEEAEVDYNALLGYGDSVYGSVDAGYESDVGSLRKSPVTRPPVATNPPAHDYEIIEELGRGTFGAVYRAVSKTGGWPVALKVQTRAPITQCLTDDAPVGLMSLEYEYRMMRLMQGTVGFPRLYGGSFDSSPQHYVMELLGMDMKGLMLSYPDHVVPRSDLVGLAHQMVDRLEAMHERGFVMYDIHLKNFLIHNEVVYVIDLAIAHPMSSSNPVRDICTQPFFGTVTNTAYASDDMLRLMYLLVAMAEGYLPWVGLGDGEKAAVKRNSRAYNVCLGRAAWLVGAFEYVESLTPGSRVDYDRLKRLLA